MEDIIVIKDPSYYKLTYKGYVYNYIDDDIFESYTGIKLNIGETTKISFKKEYWLVKLNDVYYLSTSPWVQRWFYPDTKLKNITKYINNLTITNIPKVGKLLSKKELETLFKF